MSSVFGERPASVEGSGAGSLNEFSALSFELRATSRFILTVQ